MAGSPLLAVDGLEIAFRSDQSSLTVVRDVSFELGAGETLALVGESGSGKSVTSLAVMRLLPKPPRSRVRGSIRLERRHGRIDELTTFTEPAMRQVRGNEIAMVFQEPMSSLNPVHPVGAQIMEAILLHEGVDRGTARQRATELLELVGIPEPTRRLRNFPHELSGGMRQRVMIAMALACRPRVLIADEPTTALDVTVQAQILELLQDLQARTGMAILFITHNLGVVAEIADRVMVMYAGRIVEEAPVGPLFASPRMPYTRGLLRSVPRMDAAIRGGAVLEAIPGNVPDPAHPPPGCAFEPRCPVADTDRCTKSTSPLEVVAPGHRARCWRWRELEALPR